MAAPEILESQTRRRRTFAIISHPDAGKTTLTEKLLLYGGAIHLAGAVKAKKNQKHTTSDYMEIEKQRGISINASVLQFEYGGFQINLLDTPGHKDFSEDTYRTLTAADAAVMLIDAGKGVERQTIKLFEVCAMRKIPIFTFINKLDRPGKEPMELIDELEKVLGIRSCPMTWPIGMGDRFRGVYEPSSKDVYLYQTSGDANIRYRDDLNYMHVDGLTDPKLADLLKKDGIYDEFRSELELLEMAGDPYDRERVLQGQLTPVFFGSAMNNFGVELFLNRFIEMAPSPRPRPATSGEGASAKATLIDPTDPNFSGFVFKIQANMDPQHRDRVAFLRICSGKFTRNMEVKNVRLKKDFKLSRPLHFFAQERIVVEEAWPGDIVGFVDTSGALRIGDTISEKKPLEYPSIPSFSPEFFARVVLKDPLRRKQLKAGLDQLSEEGVVQVYHDRHLGDKDPVIAAVGGLQFEVLQSRIKSEYNVEIVIEKLPYVQARWIRSASGTSFDPAVFERREDSICLLDRDENPVVLFKSEWSLKWAVDNHKSLEFLTTAPLKSG